MYKSTSKPKFLKYALLATTLLIAFSEGFGKRMPVNKCTSKKDCSPEELELNRRTEFPIMQIKKGILASN